MKPNGEAKRVGQRMLLPPVLGEAAFLGLAAAFRRKSGFQLLAVDARGCVLVGAAKTSGSASADHVRAQAIAEARRWGEPCIMSDGPNRLLWAVPVMANQAVLGGLVVSGVKLVRPRKPGAFDRRVREACHALLELAVEHNLVNQAELLQRRSAAEREREKAEATHALKASCYDDLRSIYLREEPALLSAIKRGEFAEARAVINRVLVCLYHHGGTRTDLLKSMALELVVMMTRAAVQAGGNPGRILGLNYQSLTALAKVDEQEALSHWLCTMLEQLFDALKTNNQHPNAVQLVRAVDYMEEHLAEKLGRAAVARAAGLSPGHFSHLMRGKMEVSFTQLLTRMRVDRSVHLLTRSTRNLAEIALECGFTDQSYFSRVLRKATGRTPGDYRRG